MALTGEQVASSSSGAPAPGAPDAERYPPSVPAEPADDVGAPFAGWIAEVTGAADVQLQRRSGGASRAGYAVTLRMPDGTDRELWLRCDTGAGPQSNGPYTLRREAAVYRQVRAHGVRVAEVVAVHPTEEAFLMERLHGRTGSPS